MADNVFTRMGAAAKGGAPIGASVDIARMAKSSGDAFKAGKVLALPNKGASFFAAAPEQPSPFFPNQQTAKNPFAATATPKASQGFWDDVGDWGEGVGGWLSGAGHNMFGGRLFGKLPSIKDLLETSAGQKIIRALEWGPESAGNIFEGGIRNVRENVREGDYFGAALSAVAPMGGLQWFRDDYRNNYDKAVVAEASAFQTYWLAMSDAMGSPGTSNDIEGNFDRLLDDPNAREDRRAYFAIGAAHWTTGVGDMAWQLTMDPLWVGGKAAAALKAAARTTTAADVATAAARVGDDAIDAAELSSKAQSTRDLVNGVAVAVVDHQNLPTATARLSQTRWMSNAPEGGAVAYTVAKAVEHARANGLDRAAQIEAAEDVLYAGMGHAPSLAKLRAQNELLAHEVEKMNSLYESITTHTLLTDADLPASQAVRDAYRVLNEGEAGKAEWAVVQKTVREETERLRKELNAAELAVKTGQPVSGAGPNAIGDLATLPETLGSRALGRRGTLAHVVKTVEVGKFTQPITFVAGRHLPGTVKLADPDAIHVFNEGVIRLKRVLGGVDDRALRTSLAARADALQAEMNATTSLAEGAGARARVFTQFENLIDEAVAAKHGLDKDGLAVVHNAMRSRREAEVAEVAYQARAARDVNGLPTVAIPDGTRVVFADGKWIDELTGTPMDRTRYVLNDEQIAQQAAREAGEQIDESLRPEGPVLRTQQLEFVSLLDPYQLDRFAMANFRGGLGGFVAKAGSSRAYKATTWALDASNHIWKFFALLRPFAYLVRSQLDEQLRIAGLIKTQEYMENTAEGVKNWLTWNQRRLTPQHIAALHTRIQQHQQIPAERGVLAGFEHDLARLTEQREAILRGDAGQVDDYLVEQYARLNDEVAQLDEIAADGGHLDADTVSSATRASRLDVERQTTLAHNPSGRRVRERFNSAQAREADASDALHKATEDLERLHQQVPETGMTPEYAASLRQAEAAHDAARADYLAARDELVIAGDGFMRWKLGHSGGNLDIAQEELRALQRARAQAQARADRAANYQARTPQAPILQKIGRLDRAIGKARQEVDRLQNALRDINKNPDASQAAKDAARAEYVKAKTTLERLRTTRSHIDQDAARQARVDRRMDAERDYGNHTAEVTRLDSEIEEMQRYIAIHDEVAAAAKTSAADLRRTAAQNRKAKVQQARLAEVDRLIAAKKIDTARQRATLRSLEERVSKPIQFAKDAGGKRIRLGKTDLGRHLGMSQRIDTTGVKYQAADPFDPFRTGDEFEDKIASFDTEDAIMGILYKTSRTEVDRLRRTGEWQLADPTRRGWTGGYLRLANLHIAQDPLAQRIARGADEGELIGWLRRDPEGQKYLEDMSRTGVVSAHEVLIEAQKFVDTLAPEGSVIRGKLASGQQIENADIYHTWPTQAQRPTIPMETVERRFGRTPAQDIMNGLRTIETGYFRAVAGWPAERWARQPLYVSRYKMYVDQAKARADLAKGENLTLKQIDEIRHYADQRARKDFVRYLFNTSQKSNGANMFRLVSPFYAAWEDSMVKWARIFGEDPSLIARGWDIVRAPNAAGMVHDENGNPVDVQGRVTDKDGNVIGTIGIWDGYVTVPTIGDMKGWAGVENFSIRKDSANIVFQGDPWWLPGPGPLVALPANHLVQAWFPEAWDAEGEPETPTGQVLRWALPFGPQADEGTEADLDQILPAWVKATRDLFSDTKRMDYLFTQLYQEQYNFEQRGETKQLTDDERVALINNRVRNTALLRLFGSEMPVSMHPESPLAFYRKEYQRYRREFGKEADERFREDYPDYQDLAISLSSNETGLAPTTGAYLAAEKYSKQIARDPEFGWWYAGAENLAGGFNQAVYASQLSQTIDESTNKTGRTRTDPLDSVRNTNVQNGWAEYHKFMQKIDLELEDAGLTSINVKAAAPFKALKEEFVQDLKERNNDWGDAFQSGGDPGEVARFLTMAVEQLDLHQELAERADNQALIQYVVMREKIRAEMRAIRAERGLTGTGSLNSVENEAFKAIWEEFTTDLYRRDLGFAQMWDRVLNNDDLSDSIYMDMGDEDAD